jgi:hypothetical protein
LLAQARQDRRIASGAITGSAASGREDDWSDIDLAFGIATGASLMQVLSDWTAHMYDRNSAVHHVDTRFGDWFYRTFLLPNTLQVDLAFVPSDHFQALGPRFKVVFGAANEPANFERPTSVQTNAACLAAIACATACIAKRASWQADYFLGIARDNALVSACLDYDLPYHHGRGFDLLPAGIKATFESAFATTLDGNELSHALYVIAGNMGESAGAAPICPMPELLEVDRAMGLAWLYALHARSCIGRKKVWQAEYMVRGMRDNALGLARLRSGSNPGLPLYPELLPEQIDSRFRNTRLRVLNLDELTRAFQLLIEYLSTEVSLAGVPRAQRLQQTISAFI